MWLKSTMRNYNIKIYIVQMEKSILLVKQNEKIEILVDESMLNMSILQFINYLHSVHGYTPRIYLYHHPLSAFSKLDFVSLAAKLNDVMREYPQICFTYNNTQFLEEKAPYGFKIQKREPFEFLILQTRFDNCFHHQTYRVPFDSKILFIKSLAQNYGRYSYLVYFDLIVPLDYFQANQTIENTLQKYQHIDNYIVIIVQRQQAPIFYKSIKNQSMLDKERFVTLFLQNEQCIVMDKEANCRTALQLLSFISKKQIKLPQKYKSFQNSKFRLLGVDEIKLELASSTLHSLEPATQNSIFIGPTTQYLCFLEQSYILHIFQKQPPFRLINSAFLNCQPCMHLQQQIPVLIDHQLIMYNITVSTITLKYYEIPHGNLKFNKQFNWPAALYGEIKCNCLDVIAVALKNKPIIRVFYIYSPNDFIEAQRSSEKWDIFVSKHGNNNFSDGSGLLAIYDLNLSEVKIFNLKRKEMIQRFYTPMRMQRICFNHQKPLVLMVGKNVWIQYNYMNHKVQRKRQDQGSSQLSYSPTNELILSNAKYVKFLETGLVFRAESALIKAGEIFFSKNIQNKFCLYSSIFEISENKMRKRT